ncbi:MAG: hypothetical protein ABIS18_06220 [Actinomycetota bacterium]
MNERPNHFQLSSVPWMRFTYPVPFLPERSSITLSLLLMMINWVRQDVPLASMLKELEISLVL